MEFHQTEQQHPASVGDLQR